MWVNVSFNGTKLPKGYRTQKQNIKAAKIMNTLLKNKNKSYKTTHATKLTGRIRVQQRSTQPTETSSLSQAEREL